MEGGYRLGEKVLKKKSLAERTAEHEEATKRRLGEGELTPELLAQIEAEHSERAKKLALERSIRLYAKGGAMLATSFFLGGKLGAYAKASPFLEHGSATDTGPQWKEMKSPQGETLVSVRQEGYWQHIKGKSGMEVLERSEKGGWTQIVAKGSDGKWNTQWRGPHGEVTDQNPFTLKKVSGT